jgi:hypothetical protein
VKINKIKQQGRFVSGNAPSSINIGQWQVSDASAENDYTWFSGYEEIVYSSTAESLAANGLSGRENILLLPQAFANPGTANVMTVPHIEVTYVTYEYTNNSGSYTSHTTTARASLYDILKSVGNRIDMNKKFTFNITINLDSNLIIWAPDQNDWTGNDFNISI